MTTLIEHWDLVDGVPDTGSVRLWPPAERPALVGLGRISTTTASVPLVDGDLSVGVEPGLLWVRVVLSGGVQAPHMVEVPDRTDSVRLSSLLPLVPGDLETFMAAAAADAADAAQSALDAAGSATDAAGSATTSASDAVAAVAAELQGSVTAAAGSATAAVASAQDSLTSADQASVAASAAVDSAGTASAAAVAAQTAATDTQSIADSAVFVALDTDGVPYLIA